MSIHTYYTEKEQLKREVLSNPKTNRHFVKLIRNNDSRVTVNYLKRVLRGYPNPSNLTDINVFNLFCLMWVRAYGCKDFLAIKSPKSGTRYVHLADGRILRVSNHFCKSYLGDTETIQIIGVDGIKSFFNQQSC
jgi:hypothetical protein